MKYLVKTKGNVAKVESQTYIVTAKNKQEAIENATIMFTNEHDVVGNSIMVNKPTERNSWLIISCVLMMIAVILSFIHWVDGHEKIIIAPNLYSGLFSCAFYAVYLYQYRGIDCLQDASVLDFISALLTILTLSCISNVVLYNEITIPIVNWTMSGYEILPIVAFISLLRIPILTVVSFLVIFTCACANISALNKAMGLMGFVLVFFCFSGLLIKTFMEPGFYDMLKDVRGQTIQIANGVKKDVAGVGKELVTISNRISGSKEKDDLPEEIVNGAKNEKDN